MVPEVVTLFPLNLVCELCAVDGEVGAVALHGGRAGAVGVEGDADVGVEVVVVFSVPGAYHLRGVSGFVVVIAAGREGHGHQRAQHHGEERAQMGKSVFHC